MENGQTLEQKVVIFATSEHYVGAVELLKRCRTQLTSVVGSNEFETIVNALTLELETNLIQRFVVQVDKIRSGENLNV